MHWQVVGEKFSILGSIHVSDQPLTLGGAAAEALEQAEVLAFETDFRLPNDQTLTHYSKSGRLSASIPADLFADAKAAWSDLDLPERELQTLRPWWAMLRLVFATLERQSLLAKHGIDVQILEQARATGKELRFLEKRMAGSKAFRSAPFAEQLVGLVGAVREADDGVRDARQMLTAWVSNSPAEMLPVLEKSWHRAPVTSEGLFAQRNRAWLPEMLTMIKSGRPAVATVGCLHMVGPDSLLDLLAHHGYRCELVRD